VVAAAAEVLRTPCSALDETQKCRAGMSDQPLRDSHSRSKMTSAPKANPARFR